MSTLPPPPPGSAAPMSAPPPEGRQPRRFGLAALALTGLVGVSIGVAAPLVIDAISGGEDERGITLRGAFTLTDSENVLGPWDDCTGDGGYDDFGPGMDVTVRDGDGNIVGTGRTESATLPREVEAALDDTDATVPDSGDSGEADPLMLVGMVAKLFDRTRCTVVFSVDVKDAEFYSIEVGSRGDLSYSRDELSEQDWFVELSLG